MRAQEWTDANGFGGWSHEADLLAMGAIRGYKDDLSGGAPGSEGSEKAPPPEVAK